MDSQYKLLSELLSDQAAFITSPKTSLANYWGALPPAPCPPVSTGLNKGILAITFELAFHYKHKIQVFFIRNKLSAFSVDVS